MATKQYIFGLDPSLTSFGIAVFTVQSKFVKTYRIQTKLLRGCKRLLFIEGKLQELVREYDPIFMVREDYAYCKANQAHQFGELGWAVKRMFYRNDVPFIQVSPLTVKKFITGRGRDAKNFIIREVFRKWDFTAESDDEADAYGLGKFAVAIYNKVFLEKDILKLEYEKECLSSILKSDKRSICYGETQEKINRKAKKNKKKS